jgi:hypothetical protein
MAPKMTQFGARRSCSRTASTEETKSSVGEAPKASGESGVQVILPDACALSDVDGAIREVVEVEIDRLPQFHSELIRGAHAVF